MAQGRLSPAVPVAEATVEQIGAWMSGLWQDGAVTASTAQTAPTALTAQDPAANAVH